MEDLKDKFFKLLHLDNLVENISGYVEKRLELYKLEITEDLVKVLSKVLNYCLVAILGIFCLMFFSIGLAHFLNRFFADATAGYWIVAGIYTLALLIFVLFRKSIDRNFENHFLNMIKRKHK